ncbi:DinB family protein [Chloroflexia bacterium SDU3-3]|nr:DinB family protein [Chloroflexia bacterium SDU3-3]
MNDYAAWFRTQLRSSADGLIWGIYQLSAQQRYHAPPQPEYFGAWPAARHLWHVASYERDLALPSMRQWLGAPMPAADAWKDSDETWELAAAQPFEQLVEAFQTVRGEQIALLDELADADWETPRATLWGERPLRMVVSKTFQHTYEHADTILRMGIWLRDVWMND